MKKFGVLSVFCVLLFSVMAFAAGHVGHVTPVPIVSTDVVNTISNDVVVVTPTVVASAEPVTTVQAAVESNPTLKAEGTRVAATLPAVQAVAPAGADLKKPFLFAFEVGADSFSASDDSRPVAVVKTLSGGVVISFTAATKVDDLKAADAKKAYFLLQQDDKFVSATVTKDGANGTYNRTKKGTLFLSILDNGAFDVEPLAGTVKDPSALATKNAHSSSSSGGGCSAFGFAPMGLLLLAPLVLLARKR